MKYTLAELAQKVGGRVVGDGAVEISGVGSVEGAEPGQLSFVSEPRFVEPARRSQAAALIAANEDLAGVKPLIVVAEPYRAFVQAAELFTEPPAPVRGVHPSAVVSEGVELGEDVSIGPAAVIERGARIGARAVIGAGCFVGAGVELGAESRLYPGVIIYPGTRLGRRVAVHAGTVIGSDGFGYLLGPKGHVKKPQLGRVVIEDEVEIGANCAIDRAALDATVIGAGTKIDNLVHISHGVVLGKNCVVLAQTAIGGSTRLGDHAIISSQVVIKDNLTLGRNVTIAARSGVAEDLPDGAVVWGFPAVPFARAQRIYARQKHLPELFTRVRELEKKLEALDRPKPARKASSLRPTKKKKPLSKKSGKAR